LNAPFANHHQERKGSTSSVELIPPVIPSAVDCVVQSNTVKTPFAPSDVCNPRDDCLLLPVPKERLLDSIFEETSNNDSFSKMSSLVKALNDIPVESAVNISTNHDLLHTLLKKAC
jgi:hypothetical protein